MGPIYFTYIAGAGALLLGVIITATVLRAAVTRKANDKLKLAEAEGESLKKKNYFRRRRNFFS